ncbi:hypothetical protein VNO80_19540 [Phaseolus coccineus]|uniref:Uncharacterized protein n=1 Tax=Phaseolus coccineus TaxID=3886 RepID=A0AAN9MME8_PHACN
MLLQFLCGQSSVPFSLRNPAPLQPTMALIFPMFGGILLSVLSSKKIIEHVKLEAQIFSEGEGGRRVGSNVISFEKQPQ